MIIITIVVGYCLIPVQGPSQKRGRTAASKGTQASASDSGSHATTACVEKRPPALSVSCLCHLLNAITDGGLVAETEDQVHMTIFSIVSVLEPCHLLHGVIGSQVAETIRCARTVSTPFLPPLGMYIWRLTWPALLPHLLSNALLQALTHESCMSVASVAFSSSSQTRSI